MHPKKIIFYSKFCWYACIWSHPLFTLLPTSKKEPNYSWIDWEYLLTGGSYFQPLSWNLRMKVALGAAEGLAFLHSAKTKVIYRDFKTANILLDSVRGIWFSKNIDLNCFFIMFCTSNFIICLAVLKTFLLLYNLNCFLYHVLY